jgi:hypothetical protein
VASELAREKWGGIVVSPNGVWKVLCRHGLNTRAKRLGSRASSWSLNSRASSSTLHGQEVSRNIRARGLLLDLAAVALRRLRGRLIGHGR